MKIDTQELRSKIEEHKKEIFIGLSGAAVMSLLYRAYGRKIIFNKPYLHLDFDLGMRDPSKGNLDTTTLNGFANFAMADMTIKDLGKVGKKIQEAIPSIKSDMLLSNVTLDYRIEV